MKTSKIFKRIALLAIVVTSFITLGMFTTSAQTSDNTSAEFVKKIVKEMKAEMPMDLGDGLFMTAIYTADSNIVMEITCTDAIVDLIRLGWSEMSKEESMKSFLGDSSARLMAKLCAEANYGIRYICLTKDRSNQTEKFFTPSDLKTFLSLNPQK